MAKGDPRMSDRQYEMLTYADRGADLFTGVHGMSANGGATQTLWSLYRNCWLERKTDRVTDDGRAAMAKHRASQLRRMVKKVATQVETEKEKRR